MQQTRVPQTSFESDTAGCSTHACQELFRRTAGCNTHAYQARTPHVHHVPLTSIQPVQRCRCAHVMPFTLRRDVMALRPYSTCWPYSATPSHRYTHLVVPEARCLKHWGWKCKVRALHAHFMERYHGTSNPEVLSKGGAQRLTTERPAAEGPATGRPAAERPATGRSATERPRYFVVTDLGDVLLNRLPIDQDVIKGKCVCY